MDPASNLREEAHRLVDQLPANASWDDLMYKVYVRQAVEAGLADTDARRGGSHEEVRAQFGQRR